MLRGIESWHINQGGQWKIKICYQSHKNVWLKRPIFWGTLLSRQLKPKCLDLLTHIKYLKFLASMFQNISIRNFQTSFCLYFLFIYCYLTKRLCSIHWTPLLYDSTTRAHHKNPPWVPIEPDLFTCVPKQRKSQIEFMKSRLSCLLLHLVYTTISIWTQTAETTSPEPYLWIHNIYNNLLVARVVNGICFQIFTISHCTDAPGHHWRLLK